MEFLTVFIIATYAVGLYMAWNIGANDLANAMGTSVGSKVLTVRNAVILAAVLNLLGAVLVGTQVTETVQKGIVDPLAYVATPDTFMYGAFAALLAAGLCVTAATHFQLPVSTTHAVIGAMVGFGLATKGISVIMLPTLSRVVLSWVISPLAGGVIAFFIFYLIKRLVLDSLQPLKSAIKVLPYMVCMVGMVLALSMIYKGLKNIGLDFPLSTALFISVLFGIFVGLITHVLLRFYKPKIPGEPDISGNFRIGSYCKELSRDEQYPFVEKLFGYIQILSACYVAFAHGANDVANAIGPVAAVINVVHTGVIDTTIAVPIELLILGGIGIAIGCACGYKVMETVGERITEITPTRGFSAEFSTATTVLICSKLGMPVSTTHVLVGSVIGVGFARGISALNLNVIKNIFISWVLTLPAAAILTIIIYAGLMFFL